METFELIDDNLNKAFQKVERRFKDHPVSKECFFSVREGIHDVIRSCVDNIHVAIYMDDVIDDPLEVIVGPGDNRLRITIRDNGRITYSWTKETLGKYFKDVVKETRSLTHDIVESFLKRLYNTSVEEETTAINS